MEAGFEERCTRRLSWHRPVSPLERLTTAAEYARRHGIAADRYGEGAFLEGFEAEIAGVLGMERGLFLATGGSAQLIALRVWAERAADRRIALHPRSHVELREQGGYRHVNGLEPVWVGAPERAPERADLEAAEASTILYELPLRALGGSLPSWAEWSRISSWARDAGRTCHIDGARLWEAAAAYGREPHELTVGADSVYVSFYKGLGSTTGALLAGSADFVEEARVWRDRMGARAVELYPLAIPARQCFEQRRGAFPRYHARARALATALRSIRSLRIFPDPPHTNMFHVYFEQEPQALELARDRVAREHGVWLFGFFARGLPLGRCYGEVVAGDATEDLADAEAVDLVERLLAYACEADPALRT